MGSSNRQGNDRLPVDLEYEKARDLAADADPAVRKKVAAHPGVAAEILYYLAEDEDITVRLAVACNPTAPAKANLMLAGDEHEDVRASLAEKLSGFAGQLNANEVERTRQVLFETISRLAQDEAKRVRAVVSEAVSESLDADHDLINLLARDLEIMVAGPVLEKSPILTDDDLLDIIQSSPISGALSAISNRKFVGSKISEAIVASGDSSAITFLLKNGNAQLQENTLDQLIQKSHTVSEWQDPLVYRPELTERSAAKLANIVAENLLIKLAKRHELGDEAVQKILGVVQERLGEQAAAQVKWVSCLSNLNYDDYDAAFANVTAKVQALITTSEQMEPVADAAIMSGDVHLIIAIFAQLSNLSIQTVVEILQSHSPRAIVSLVWAVGFSADFSVKIQKTLAGLSEHELLLPHQNGSYPLSPSTMGWQLDIFSTGHQSYS